MGHRVGIWLGPDDEDLEEALAKQPNKSVFIKKAVRAYLSRGGDSSEQSALAEDIARRVVDRLRSLGLVMTQQVEAGEEDEVWLRRLRAAQEDFFE